MSQTSPLVLDDLPALAERYGTPFYLYDLDAALAHHRSLRAGLPDFVEILYCVKANSNRRVLAAFRTAGPALDLSSAGELDLAVAAGFAPDAMSFAGPGKTTAELEHALGAGLGILSLESAAEMQRASAVAAKLGRRQDVTLRINPLETPKEFAMRMGGVASQFGVPEEDASPVVAQIRAQKSLNLVGFHIYSGTQCLEAAAVVANIQGSLAICRRLAEEHDLTPEVVNLGGGFGIPYFAGQEAMDPASLAAGIRTALEAFRAEVPRFGGTRFLLELGRYLIGPFGVYVSRVTEIKETRGKRFVILDGGMNHCFPATGNFGQMVKKNYPVVNLSREPGELTQEVCGPLCTPMDSLARGIKLAPAQPNDLLAFLASGAYSYGASPLLFLSHDTPLELVRFGGEISVARERMAASRFA